MVGDYGVYYKHFYAKDAADRFGLDMVTIHKGEEKARPNPYDELRSKDKDFLEEIVRRRSEELVDAIYDLRKRKLTEKGVTKEKFIEVTKQGRLTVDSLIKYGIVDEINTTLEVKNHHHEDTKNWICTLPPGRLDSEIHYTRVNTLQYVMNSRQLII